VCNHIITAAAIATAAQMKSTANKAGLVSPPELLEPDLRANEGFGGVADEAPVKTEPSDWLADPCPEILGAKGERVTLKAGLGAPSSEWAEPNGEGAPRGDFGAGAGESGGVLMRNRGSRLSSLADFAIMSRAGDEILPAGYFLSGIFFRSRSATSSGSASSSALPLRESFSSVLTTPSVMRS